MLLLFFLRSRVIIKLVNNMIDSIIDNIKENLRFKDAIFYKNTSELQDRYDALKKLSEEYPKNKNINDELYIVKKGLDGENEIAYQLKKSNIGMYVLRDIKIQYMDMTAQIDFLVITPMFDYFIECKNLTGNITVNEKGDFIREIYVGGKKIKKGMYSPLRQVEAQRDVMRKIWEANTKKIIKLFAAKNYNYFRRVLVVVANQESLLNTSKAPADIKNRVIKADALVRQLQYDYNHRDQSFSLSSQKEMEASAKSYFDLSIKNNINYYEYYKNKFIKENYLSFEIISDTALKEKLISFRNTRSKEMNIPAYYVFTNEELEKLVALRPKTIEDMKFSAILSPIKIKTHGEKIINIINNK